MVNKKGVAAYQRYTKPSGFRQKGKTLSPKGQKNYFRTNIEQQAAQAKKKKKDLITTDKPKESGARKAAKLLLLVGKEEASQILQHMSIDEVRAVIYELARIKYVNPLEAEETLLEFDRKADEKGLYTGGVDIARGFLKTAFGPEKSERILRNAAGDLLDKPFDFLDDLELPQLVSILKPESIETLAVVCLYLKPAKAKTVLENMPALSQTDLVKRIATIRRVDSHIIMRIEEVLRERIRQQGGPVVSTKIDGRAALANILRHMSVSDEKKLLDQLAVIEPEIAKTVEQQLITMDVILYMSNRDLHEIFHGMDEKDIALLIKDKTDEVRQRILGAVSNRKRAMILEEEQILGLVRRKEVDKVTREFLDGLKAKEQEGKITILRPGEKLL